jgi:hypothetical protein
VVSITPRPRFTPGERTPGTHCTGGWVGPRAGLNTETRGKILSPLPGIEPRSPGRPARSQTLYWLSYPSHKPLLNGTDLMVARISAWTKENINVLRVYPWLSFKVTSYNRKWISSWFDGIFCWTTESRIFFRTFPALSWSPNKGKVLL